MIKRIQVDFNTTSMDTKGRVYLARNGSVQAEEKLLENLIPGEKVVLFDEELEVEAAVEFEKFHETHQAWLGKPDWSTRQDL